MATNAWNHGSSATVTDNHALIGKKPNKVIGVPPQFRRPTLLSERKMLANEIKVSTDCDILPRWEHGKIFEFHIFGSGANLDKAIREINEWIQKAPTKSAHSSKWAKLRAYDPDDWFYEGVTELEQDRRKDFLGPIPEALLEQKFVPRLIRDWPEELSSQSITPRDRFGNKLEALNSIRVEEEVYITLLPARGDIWEIEIVGYDIENVESAYIRLSTLIDRSRDDHLGLQSTLNLILDEVEGIDVVFEKADSWWPSCNDRLVPRLIPNHMMNESGTFRQESLHSAHLERIQNAFQLALEAARHKRGVYDMSIRLGCLLLDSKHMKDDKIGHVSHKESFLKQINGVVGMEVRKWLSDNERGRQILDELMSAEDILEPTRSAGYHGSNPASLKKTRPLLRGTWVFRDPSSIVAPPRVPVRHSGRPAPLVQNPPNRESPPPPVTLVVVQVDWADDEDGRYDKIASRFFQLERSNRGPKENMDINLLELGESRGWHFALESLLPLSRKSVSPLFTDFADRVKMPPKYDISSSQRFVAPDQKSTIMKHLQNSRLDSIYSFAVKDSDYKVEFSAMWYPEQKLPVWGLTLRHSEWATHLAELERLPAGHQADWGNTISTFLPEDDMGMSKLRMNNPEANSENTPAHNGMRILIDKLMQLSTVVSSVTNAPGGVNVDL